MNTTGSSLLRASFAFPTRSPTRKLLLSLALLSVRLYPFLADAILTSLSSAAYNCLFGSGSHVLVAGQWVLAQGTLLSPFGLHSLTFPLVRNWWSLRLCDPVCSFRRRQHHHHLLLGRQVRSPLRAFYTAELFAGSRKSRPSLEIALTSSTRSTTRLTRTGTSKSSRSPKARESTSSSKSAGKARSRSRSSASSVLPSAPQPAANEISQALGGMIGAIGFVAGEAKTPLPNVNGMALAQAATLRGILIGSRQQFEAMNQHITATGLSESPSFGLRKGELTSFAEPLVDKVFEFEQLKEAYDYQWSQQVRVSLSVRRTALNVPLCSMSARSSSRSPSSRPRALCLPL